MKLNRYVSLCAAAALTVALAACSPAYENTTKAQAAQYVAVAADDGNSVAQFVMALETAEPGIYDTFIGSLTADARKAEYHEGMIKNVAHRLEPVLSRLYVERLIDAPDEYITEQADLELQNIETLRGTDVRECMAYLGGRLPEKTSPEYRAIDDAKYLRMRELVTLVPERAEERLTEDDALAIYVKWLQSDTERAARFDLIRRTNPLKEDAVTACDTGVELLEEVSAMPTKRKAEFLRAIRYSTDISETYFGG